MNRKLEWIIQLHLAVEYLEGYLEENLEENLEKFLEENLEEYLADSRFQET